MSAVSHVSEGGYTRTRINRMGLGLFLLSEAFLFGVLLGSRFMVIGTETPDAVNQVLGGLLTVILLTSSACAHLVHRALAADDRARTQRWLAVTAALGVAFLAIVVYEWNIGFQDFPPSTLYGSLFYLITGTHALHLLIGVIMLGFALLHSRKGLFTAQQHWGGEATVWYWHFVDGVWLTVFATLYLVGS